MTYEMLVVSRAAKCPRLEAIEDPLSSEFDAAAELLAGTAADWREIELGFVADEGDDGTPVDPLADFATIRRIVEPKEVAARIAALVKSLALVEPKRTAAWLMDWLRSARAIYSFTLHHERFDEAMATARAVMWSIQQATDGISHAPGEGWSNVHGQLITWQFDRKGSDGPWRCAVLDADGRWVGFQIDLGDPLHRKAFRDGRVPKGVDHG